jgi:uncharacterized membrane protein
LTTGPVRTAATLALGGELVVDKLPWTPSRLEPAPLAARAVLAGVAGAVIARSAGRPAAPAVLAGSAAALVGARLGHDARAAADRHAPALAVAVAEDALALRLARAGSRGRLLP